MSNVLIGMPASKEHMDMFKKALGRDYVPSPGAQKVACDRCGTLAWMGAKQIENKAAHPDVQFWCPGCLIADLKEGKHEVSALSHLGGGSIPESN